MAPVPGSNLEHFGVSDPTNAARNYYHKDFIERCLSLVKWSYETNPEQMPFSTIIPITNGRSFFDSRSELTLSFL